MHEQEICSQRELADSRHQLRTAQRWVIALADASNITHPADLLLKCSPARLLPCAHHHQARHHECQAEQARGQADKSDQGMLACRDKLATEERAASLEQQIQEAHSMLDEQRAWASNTLQDSSAGRAEVAALQAQAQHLTQASSDDDHAMASAISEPRLSSHVEPGHPQQSAHNPTRL